MLICVPLNIHIFERGWRGQPTTSYVTDLGGRTETHEHTIGAAIGFESMTESLTVPHDEAMDWLINGLGRRCEVYGPDADSVWEGQLTTIEANFGQESRGRTLDGMANSIVVQFLDANGLTASYFATDTTSVDLYGEKESALSGRIRDATAATQTGAAHLAAHANPIWSYSTDVGAAAAPGLAALRLSFSGWYTTLDWPFATDTTSTTLTSTTTQVVNLLTTFNGATAFLSTDYSQIAASGVSDTEAVDINTKYRTKIEALLAAGTSANQRQAWGVYEGRRFQVKTWAGASPSTITYQRALNERVVRDGKGNVVPLWLVRPDANYRVIDLLDVLPTPTTPDSAARSFVERVTCRITRESVGLRLEGQGGDTLDHVLARIRA